MNAAPFSVITAVMNRPERLADAFPNWLACPDVAEIVVVDWTSGLPVAAPPEIKLIRVEAEPCWRPGLALNLAAQFATCDVLAKLDVDYRIRPDFLARIQPPPGQFSRGKARLATFRQEVFLNGFSAVQRQDFFAVNGYNERTLGYGFDDDDLYHRLASAGLKPRDVRGADGIAHLAHPDTGRSKREWFENKAHCESRPWSIADQRAEYLIESTDQNRWTAVRRQATTPKVMQPGC